MTSASALNAGFIFTIITLLLTQLPSALLYTVLAQIVLIFLYIVFMVLLFVIVHLIIMSSLFTRPIPPRSKQIWFVNILWAGSISATGFVPILLFLLWNLVFLVNTALIVWIFTFVIVLSTTSIPYLKTTR